MCGAGDIYVGEGTSEPGTLVFPNDPKRRIEIIWHDTKTHRRPSVIRIGEGSTWRVPGPGGKPIGIGMPMAEIETLNGRPFRLSGFDWDYGGTAVDWRGGALARLPAGCLFGARFERDPDASEKAGNDAAGDRSFSSSSSAMRAVKPTLSEVILSWVP